MLDISWRGEAARGVLQSIRRQCSRVKLKAGVIVPVDRKNAVVQPQLASFSHPSVLDV